MLHPVMEQTQCKGKIGGDDRQENDVCLPFNSVHVESLTMAMSYMYMICIVIRKKDAVRSIDAVHD